MEEREREREKEREGGGEGGRVRARGTRDGFSYVVFRPRWLGWRGGEGEGGGRGRVSGAVNKGRGFLCDWLEYKKVGL